MTLTNYWWLLIWIFLGGGILSYVIPKQKEVVLGKVETRWTPFAAIALMLPYIIWTGFRSDIYGDTGAYRGGFFNAPSELSQLIVYVLASKKDKGFAAVTVMIKSIVGDSDIFYFVIIAMIQLLVLVYVYRKYSCNYWLSIFLFIASTDYLSYAHNGMRQFLGLSIAMLATDFLVKKKYIPMIILILVGATMHGSILLMLPMAFIVQGKAWNKKTVICIILSLMVLVYVEQFTNVLDDMLTNTQYSNMVTDWREWEDDGTNPLRVLVYSMPMFLSVIGFKFIKTEKNPMIHIATNYSIITCGIALISMVTSGIFIGRLIILGAVYSNAILLPWEIEHIFTKKSSQFVLMCTVAAYCLFFFYQMHFGWGLL